MAVKDEVAAIHAGAGTLAQKARSAANLKAHRIADAVAALPTQSRTYTRNGVKWTVSNFSAAVVNGVTMFRLTATAQTAPSGAMLITATDPLNPMHFVNPPILVPDGGKDGQGNPTFKENLVEAVKAMLDAQLVRKQG